MKFTDLWSSEGTIDRGPYALVGLVGFAIKHNLDRALATFVFHRKWGLFNYWIPLDQAVRDKFTCSNGSNLPPLDAGAFASIHLGRRSFDDAAPSSCGAAGVACGVVLCARI